MTPRHAEIRALAAVLTAVLVVALGCASSDRLLKVARTAPVPQERRDAMLHLRGRVRPDMREGVEAVLLTDGDPATRALAAQALGDLADPAAAPALRRSLDGETYALVRQRALEALVRLPNVPVAADLREVLAADRSDEVRAAAVRLSASALDVSAATPLLLAALEDSSALVRIEAQRSLRKLTGLDAPPDRARWEEALKAQQAQTTR